MKIEPWGIPELIEHNSWTIWGWTGWKGTKSSVVTEQDTLCPICGKRFSVGDSIELVQDKFPRHWLCVYPGNVPDRLMGQWLAQKGEGHVVRRLAVNVDNLVAEFIDGSAYKHGFYGADFPVSTEGEFITEHTPDAAREIARQIGLYRLKYLIDQVEAQEVETK